MARCNEREINLPEIGELDTESGTEMLFLNHMLDLDIRMHGRTDR